MITFDGQCAGGWLCISWEHVANQMFDTAFYGVIGLAVTAWLLARLLKRRKAAEEVT